jgi:hypothetical protein
LVVEEDIKDLENGTTDNWEVAYNEMIRKMKEAGADKVIEEMQRQVDLFKSQ